MPIYGTDDSDTLSGNFNDDFIYGFGGNDTLYGNGGNDFLNGGAGSDIMVGGSGDDIFVVDSSADVVLEQAGQGADWVWSSISYTLGANVENLTLSGTAAINGGGNGLDNTIRGNGGNNMLHGLGGDDVLDGQAGADAMFGGDGDDVYYVDNGGDQVFEVSTGGIDEVRSTVSTTLAPWVENLTLLGAASINGTGNGLDNIITGNTGTNVLTGGGGKDTLDGKGGADTMIGGTGDDTYFVDNANDVVVEQNEDQEGWDFIRTSVSYTMGANVEVMQLMDSGGAINGTGSDGYNNIIGNASANVLTGSGGDDDLVGGGGIDTMIGGIGDDTYMIDQAGDVLIEKPDEGLDSVYSPVTYTLGVHLDNLFLLDQGGAINGTGNELDNHIGGNASSNILVGAAGDDALSGGGGIDTLIGGIDDDLYVADGEDIVVENANEGVDAVAAFVTYTLPANVENLYLQDSGGAINGTGNDLANVLIGNNAPNVLIGGLGLDTLAGHGGADTFVWASTAESGHDADQVDIVTDFNLQGGDVLDLHLIDADETLPGDQAFTFNGLAQFTGPGQIYYFTNAADTYILLNTDADPDHEMAIRVNGVHTVTANWFVL